MPVKVTLLLPPMSLEERYGKAISKVAGTFPPLGLLSLGTILKEKGHNPVILDGSIVDFDYMMNVITSEKPRVIGISVMTFLWPKVKKIIERLKKSFPDIFIVIGGVHASISGEKCLRECEYLDAVVCGEGEFTLLEIVERIDKGESLAGIKGTILRDESGIVVNPPREIIQNIDQLPLPDRKLVNISDYLPAFSQYKKLPVTNMFTTRGCPFNCIFCIPDVLGNQVRFRTPESIINEVRHLKDTYGIKEVAFWDDTFTINRNRVLEICRLLKESGMNMVWSAQARADRVDKEMLKIMADAGCWKIHFGFESMVQATLDTLRKGTTVEQNFNAARWTSEAGMEVEGSIIFGIPNETFEDGLTTIKLIKKMNIDYARFFSLTPYGELAQRINEFGTIISDDLSKYQGNEIVFVPYSMTKNELEKLISTAYTEFYFRPKYILKRLRKMTSFRTLKQTIMGAKAVFMIATKGADEV